MTDCRFLFHILRWWNPYLKPEKKGIPFGQSLPVWPSLYTDVLLLLFFRSFQRHRRNREWGERARTSAERENWKNEELFSSSPTTTPLRWLFLKTFLLKRVFQRILSWSEINLTGGSLSNRSQKTSKCGKYISDILTCCSCANIFVI